MKEGVCPSIRLGSQHAAGVSLDLGSAAGLGVRGLRAAAGSQDWIEESSPDRPGVQVLPQQPIFISLRCSPVPLLRMPWDPEEGSVAWDGVGLKNHLNSIPESRDFPNVKASALNVGDPGLIPGLGRSPGEGNGHPLPDS